MASTIKVNEIQNLAGNTALTIDGNGVVDIPELRTTQMPRFYARLASHVPYGIGYQAEWWENQTWNVHYNVGNMFNAGIVTIPSDGFYQLHMSVYCNNSGGTYIGCFMYGDGITEATGNSIVYSFRSAEESSDIGTSLTIPLQCSAGSVVKFGAYGNGSSQTAKQDHTFLWGYKIG